jgi:hypothetical protein
MKTKFNLLIILILVLVTLGQPTTAHAVGTRVFRSNGPTAIATFFDISDCLYSETAIMVSESRDRNEPGPAKLSSFAAVSVFQFDICTDTLLYYAYGDTSPLSPEEFQISHNLASATLNTTISVFDEASGQTLDLAIDMTWTATSPVMRDQVTEHLHTPHCLVHSHHQRKSRLAEAVGTVTYGSTNFTPEPAVDAILVWLKNGTVIVGCDDE